MRDFIGELLQQKQPDYVGELLGRKREEDLLKPPEFMPAESVTTTVAKPGEIVSEAELHISAPVPKKGTTIVQDVDIAGPLKGIAHAIVSAPQAVGALVKEYGERMEENPDFWDLMFTMPIGPTAVLAKQLQAKAARKTDVDEKIARIGEDIIKKNEVHVKKLTVIHPRTGKVNELLFGLGSGATSLAAAIGLSYLTKSPHAAAVAFGAYQKSLMYEEARRAGKEPKEAGRISTVAGAIEGGLEYVGLNLILGKYAGNLLGTMATEAFQEFSQEVGGNLVAKQGFDKARNIWQGAWEAAVMGAILGGPASLVTGKIKNTEIGAAFKDGGVDIGGVVEDAQKRVAPELERIAKKDFVEISDKMVDDLVKQEARLKVEEKEPTPKPTTQQEAAEAWRATTPIEKEPEAGARPLIEQVYEPKPTDIMTGEELTIEQQVVRKPRAKKVQTEFEGAVKPKMQDEFIKPAEVKDVKAERENLESSNLFEATVPATQLTLGGQKLPAIDAKMQMNLAGLGYSIGQINKMSPKTAQDVLRDKIDPDNITIQPDGSWRHKRFRKTYEDPFTGEEVTKKEYDFLTGGEETLNQAVLAEGGIAFEKREGVGLAEEYETIPIVLRNSKGLSPDEMADALKRRHQHLEIKSENDMLEAFRNQSLNYLRAGVNLREGWENLKGFYSSKIGQPAFNQLSKLVPKTLKKYFTPYHGWNQYVQYLYRDMIYDRIGRMAEAGETMGRISKLNTEEKIAAYYLATKQPLPEGITSTPRAEEVSKMVNTEFNKLGDEAVKLGIMPETSFRKFFDRYLPRLYEIYERNRGTPGTFRQSLRMDLERFMKRSEDLPQEWREAAGEIKDVSELFSKGVMKEVYDVTLNRFQKRLRVLPAELTEGIKVVATTAEAKAMEELGQFDINNYHRLPDSKNYGDLRNCYIRKDVWSELKGMYRVPGQWDEIIRIHNKLLTLWKMGKTVFSPATQMRNFYFGIIQCDWGDGFNANAIKEFAKAVATKNDLYKELRREGILSSGMVHEEMTGYLHKMKRADNRIEKVIDFSTDLLMEKLQGKRAAQLYGASDDLFRSLIFTSQKLKGKSAEEARDLANFYMVNYREVGPAIKFLRMGPSPFATFYNGFIQAAAHTAIVKPWKLAKWYLILSTIGALGLKESKELKERKRKAMPQYIPELIADKVPAFRLPWKTQRGEDLFLDLTYVVPFLDMGVEFFRMTKGELKPLHPAVAVGRASIRLVNHPVLRWMSDVMQHGVDPFTREELDTPGKILDYTYKQLMPNLMPEVPFTGIKGGWGYEAFKGAVEKKPTAGRGYVRGIPETIGRHVLGIKTIPVDYGEELNSRIRYATFLMSESENMIRRVAKNKSLTAAEKHRETQDLVKEIGRLGEMIKNWKEQRDWFLGFESKSSKRDYIGELLGK